MNQRTTLAVAAAITAFVLVVAGALIGRLSAVDGQAEAAAAVAATAASFAERETAYQTSIAEANRRLEQANQLLARQQPTPQPSPPAAPAAVSSYAVSGEQAQAIALEAEPGSALLKPAELVSYQGTPAYEVLLDRGTIYIDAQQAAILASSVVGTSPTAGAVGGPVTAEQAAQIAQAYRGDGQVSEVERERGRHGTIYEVEFNDGGKVYVDAATGQVVYAQLEDTEHEDREGDRDDEG